LKQPANPAKGTATNLNQQTKELTVLDLTPRQTLEYLQKSYGSVDGLWFMKVEEVLGFEQALDIDERVWQIMPKIQARTMKEFADIKQGIDALRECFEAKLTLDGFIFTTTQTATSFTIKIASCPWYDKLVKSKRTHLAERISNRICIAEYSGWAKEFGCSFEFVSGGKICTGCTNCGLVFINKA
jgi:hypothetical protein